MIRPFGRNIVIRVSGIGNKVEKLVHPAMMAGSREAATHYGVSYVMP